MCSVSYVPLKEGFVFTSNRDERINRQTSIDFVKEVIGGKQVSFPKDLEAGGTWFAYSDDVIVCLLNGAFTKHIRKKSYRMSRGKIVLDTFNFSTFSEFVKNTSLEGVEPFTLISVSVKDNLIQELRWDEDKCCLKDLSLSEPYLWSSVTLYSKEKSNEREAKFYDSIEVLTSSQTILDYHTGQGDYVRDNLLLDLGEKATVSTTQVITTANGLEAKYYPLYKV